MNCICSPSDPLERNGHSASCNRAQRRADKEASKPKKKPVRINKVSDKMAIALREYAKLRKEFLEANPKCEVFPDKQSVDVHHQKGRSTIELLLDTNYWIAVSREGHSKIELNPEWAKEQGFSISRLATIF